MKLKSYLTEDRQVITDTIRKLSAQKIDAIRNYGKYEYDLDTIKSLYDAEIDVANMLGDIEQMLHTISIGRGGDYELQKSLLFISDKIEKICKKLITQA